MAAKAAATPYLTAGLTVDTQPTPSGAANKAAASGYSSLWGKNGELWKPSGPLPDFSFAGEAEALESIIQ